MPFIDLTDFGALVLRLVFGALTFAHGLSKTKALEKFARSWELSHPVAFAVMLVQLIGGALIFMGLFTQLAGLANAGLNTVILYSLVFKSDEPFLAPGQHSWSIGVAYLGMALAVTGLGSGPFSLDALLF